MRIGMRNKNRGQNLIEYGMVLVVVTVALLGMRIYFQRGVQSVIKVTADDYSNIAQGERVNNAEYSVKNFIYTKENKVAYSTTSKGSWNQTMLNKGDSNSRTETSGYTEAASNSVSIGGDFTAK
jgi:hypothetical protein